MGGKNKADEELAALSKKGYQFLKENKNSGAMTCFSRILELDPWNNYALVGMGDAQRRSTNFLEAIDYYNRCVEKHPGNNYALFGLADCYKAMGEYKKAVDIWERYVKRDNRNISVLTRIADAYRKLHDFQNSKLTYQRVLEIEPYNAYAIIGLGYLHYDFKEYHDALFYWEKMIEQQGMLKANIRLLTSIGNCYRKLKVFDEGISYFDAALHRESTNFYALFGLGDCYRGLNQPHRALEYWNVLLKEYPHNKVILTRAGDAYCALQNFKSAIEYYNQALNIEFDVYAILGLAIISKLNGKYKDAINSLRDLIEKDKRNPRIYLELSDCYEKKGDKKSAISVLEEYLNLGARFAPISERLETLKPSR